MAVAVLGIPPNGAHGQTKLVMVFNPILETDVVLFSGQQIGRMLGTALGIPVEAVVATSYAATILALCAGRADVAFLSPFAYVLPMSSAASRWLRFPYDPAAPTIVGKSSFAGTQASTNSRSCAGSGLPSSILLPPLAISSRPCC